jgi:hypothetical protein
MYDASNRKQIREAEKAARRADKDRVEFLRATLNHVQGRTWFYTLLADCHCFNQPPTFDPHKDYFALGERNVGLRIFAEIIAHCPDQYLQMMKEADARDLLTDTRTEHAGSPEPGWDVEGREHSEQPDSEPDLFDAGDPASIN